MLLKQFTIDSQNIGQQEFLRPNVGYRYFFDIKNQKVWNKKKTILLKYVLKLIRSKKVRKGELENKEIVLDIGNIERRCNNLINYEEFEKIGSSKNVLESGDLIIPKLQPQMGNMFLNLKHKKYLGSSELLEYKILNNSNPIFIYYLITHKDFLHDLASLESGKTHRRVNSIDLFKIKIPFVSKLTQDQIVTQIKPIENKIKELKSKIVPVQEIINKVFAREFKFDLEKFEELGKGNFFEVNFLNFNTPLIRSTVIQNNYKSNYLKQFLKNNNISLKDIIIRPIKRGKQPKYVKDGIKVIKTLNIQKGEINFNEVQFISDNFLKKNKEKAGIYQNDLLLTSTGMGRGKFAIYNDEEICFADSHISIIRLNQNKILPYFLNYYCQSFFGVEQLKYIEMHIKGTPEIYESQLNYFQILNIPLKNQQKIIDEIKTELDKQEDMNKKIEKERNKIDEIIEKAIAI
ncbi:MAG: hypothetical protein ABIH51_01725 [Patescibacteria group bacterium]